MADFRDKTVALVVSTFYSDLSDKLVEGAKSKFVENGGSLDNLQQFNVPGSFEIPQVANKVVQSGEFDAVVCLGVVIRGDTPHFDYVCENVTRGVGEIARNAKIPVIFGVLTTENKDQALERSGGKKGHKGEEGMMAALEIMITLKKIKS
tara:strand:- start:11915 stop:12364 length:450 start_codon:yes stop_codon:yes gene_type:complete